MLGCATNGGGMWSIYTGNNKGNQVPTEIQWNKFREVFSLPKYQTFEEVFNNDIGKGNVLSGFNFRIKNRCHPTQKPIKLMEYLVQTYSHKNQTVLDFCMGSGSTGVACINTERKFIGIEKEREYYEIAKDRLQKTKSLKRNTLF